MKWLQGLKKYELILSVSVIVLVSVFAYAPFITQLGYYKEDWYMMWAGLARGPATLIDMFMADRPLHGYWYAFLFSLFREAALPWYLSSLLMRIATGFVAFWLFRILWPDSRLEATVVGVLFPVYPGFIQQAQAIGFSGHFIALLAVLTSVTLTIYATHRTNAWQRWLAEAGALILLLLYPVLLEYYLGFEGVRLLLLGYQVVKLGVNTWQQAARKILLRWLPYFVTISGFLYWRLFIFSGERRTTNVGVLMDTYASNPILMLPRIIIELVRDMVEALFMAWAVPLERFFYLGSFKDNLLTWGIALLAVLVIWVFLRLFSNQSVELPLNAAAERIVLGFLMVLMTLIPAILANRHIEFYAREDRFSLPASLGVIICVVAIIFQYTRARARTIAILGLVWISVLTQLNTAISMRDFWSFQRLAWWQIAWRAPQLEPGTVLLFDQHIEKLIVEDYEVWTPANLIYYPESTTPVVSGEMLFDPSVVHEVLRGADKPFIYRRIPVSRDFSKVLIVSMPAPNSCVNLIDGAKPEISSLEEPIVHTVAAKSQIDLIQVGTDPQIPPATLFGSEPDHTWCYYYQKASLARQMGDWEEVIRLAESAQKKNFGPFDYYEWMPFFEAYANLGMQAEAKNLAKIIKTDFGARNQICRGLETYEAPAGYNADLILELLCQ